jgi:flagellar hook-associated protein 3 FlgL
VGSFRVTERSIATTVLNNLQGNINRVNESQQQLSSGKLISRASDNPGGAVAAMQLRSDIALQQQYSRNADDGVGWLGVADSTLSTVHDEVTRVRDLLVQGMNTGASSPDARAALATEITGIRDAVLNLANARYLNRPVFGGTTTGQLAFDQTGTYIGDGGTVQRTVGDNTKVRVDVDGTAAFGTGTTQLFSVLNDAANALNTNPSALPAVLDSLDTAAAAVRTAQSTVGARYNQLTQTQQTASDRVLSLTTQLSDIEDIDLPKTITDLQLRQTAYQAALAATAKVVQPSLVDFLK